MNIPRTWLLALAALLWSVPAFLLIARAYAWTDHLAPGVRALLITLSGVLVALVYAVGFRRIVLQNIARIRSLPHHVRIWHVSSVRGYLMIGIMVLAGVVLRGSGLPAVWLAGPYALMGGCLLVGSVHMGRTFFQDLDGRS